MKTQILDTSLHLFLSYGFKTITMDDIAKEMKISKKTLYQVYSKKEDLIENVVENIHSYIDKEIQGIIDLDLNPVEEFLRVRKKINELITDQFNEMCTYQLEKFYPEVDKKCKDKNLEKWTAYFQSNLTRGIKIGCFRKNLDPVAVSVLFIREIFELQKINLSGYKLSELKDIKFELFIRGIVSENGLNLLNKLMHEKN